MNWTDGLSLLLGILKYLFLAVFALFVVYVIGLLRRSID